MPITTDNLHALLKTQEVNELLSISELQTSGDWSQVKNTLQPYHHIVHLGHVDGVTKSFISFEGQKRRRKAEDIA